MSSSQRSATNPPQTILVVDNLEAVRGVTGLLSRRRSYRVAGADCGEQAV